MKDRDTNLIAAQLIELGTKHKQTDVVEYERALHVRVGRRVVAVYYPDEDTVRVNDVFNATDRKRLNEVLTIVELPRRLEVIEAGHTVDGIDLNSTPIWRHLCNGARTAFIPRKSFSCLSRESLCSAAARLNHEEALNG